MLSSYQLAILKHVSEGSGNMVVQARAGSGKTFTIVEALKAVRPGKTVLMVAFNKSIAIELARRAPKGVEVKTLHGHGYGAVRRAFRGVEVNDDRTINLATKAWGEAVTRDQKKALAALAAGPAKAKSIDAGRGTLAKLQTLGFVTVSDKKDGVWSLTAAGRAKLAVAFNYRALKKLVGAAKDTLVARGDLLALDTLIESMDVDAPEDQDERVQFVAAAMKLLVESTNVTTEVDFSDMCWLPVVLGLRVWAFDFVFVDETQDLCPVQIELLLKCVRPNGRVCAVGDDRQAIYSFRGADESSMPKLTERLEAKTFPLSISYRCANAIVALAKSEVADFEAAPNAAEGSVQNCEHAAMVMTAGPGDMIISRANAPLVGLCLQFLRQGRKAAIKGQDVGEGLVALVEKSDSSSVEGLITWIKSWGAKEKTRLLAKDADADVSSVDDKVDCVLALTEGATSVGDVVARTTSLFTKTDDESRITLGTTHKLKGLEADRVWMLESTYRRNKGGEEANCWYVAVTRAKSELFLVQKEKKVAEG